MIFDTEEVIFRKCRIDDENDETIGVYERLYFKDIFPEEKLKEYLEELEKIWNKNGKYNTEVNSIVKECNKYSWFYTEKVPYFLKKNNETNKEIKDENYMKNGSSINPHNLGEKEEDYKVLEDHLIDQYDEETVLLQIPQEDTKIEDVMKKFKNPNKAAETIVILRDKGKVIVGQGYIRRIAEPQIKYSDETNRFGLDT